MNSVDIKIALLSYCRFQKQMGYLATEVLVSEGCLADVLASDGDVLVEYEIKTSLRDLIIDSRKPKHIIYDPTPIEWDGNRAKKKDLQIEIREQLSWNKDKVWHPFIVSDGDQASLSSYHKSLDEAKKFVESYYGSSRTCPNMLYYVIPKLLWDKNEDKIRESLSNNYGIITIENRSYRSMNVVRKAKKLHKNKPSVDSLNTLVWRMSSELASLTYLYYREKDVFMELGKNLEDSFKIDD